MPEPDERHHGLRTVVADSHHLARSGLVRTLEQAGHTVLAEESDGEAALRAVAAHSPDVLLVALDLGGVERGHVVAIARDRWPALTVVALSDVGGDDSQLAARGFGASGAIGDA